MLGLVKAAETLALGVNQGEFRSKLAKNGNRRRLIIDKNTAFT